MRPKLVLVLLIITEIFLVLIAFSPSVGMSVRSLVAASEWRRNPNPEMEKAMREEIVWNEWRPRIVWTLVGLNVPLMVYAARRVLSSLRLKVYPYPCAGDLVRFVILARLHR